ncbi:NAD(P)-dependent oxidoreductase [Acidithiobacillus sp. AMEEHan]|uniref:NAD(P)-dependent oxidoreductase n=1 Tax=Acidithiobacillus sp. AMEEHan TaxID=2994951 RepID=UPI0027E59ACA|nr:NAD(P)-dependent oxidoreductase [Acidithiobacillus sp. AMEEHan]
MKIGFLGLGRMGSAMAQRLLAATTDLIVYNRSTQASAALVAQGARAVARPGAMADRELVFTMLADDQALRDVVLASGALLESLPEGAVHVSCSTISMALAAELAERHAAAGQHFVSLPVFGRPDAAAAGKLFLVAGGAEEIVERLRPVFLRMGQDLWWVSPQPELANLVKLSGNFLIATTIESMGEAMALVEKGGVDRHAYLDFLTRSLFTAPVHRNYGKLIADRAVRPAGFAAPLGQKDLRLVGEAAEKLAVPMPFFGPLRERFLALAARGEKDVDWAALGVEAARGAGLHSTNDDV